MFSPRMLACFRVHVIVCLCCPHCHSSVGAAITCHLAAEMAPHGDHSHSPLALMTSLVRSNPPMTSNALRIQTRLYLVAEALAEGPCVPPQCLLTPSLPRQPPCSSSGGLGCRASAQAALCAGNLDNHTCLLGSSQSHVTPSPALQSRPGLLLCLRRSCTIPPGNDPHAPHHNVSFL